MAEPFASWAVVEVMGHVRMAGMVSEQTIGGAALIRVDVPEVPGHDDEWGRTYPPVAAFTKFLGSGSIYSLTPCTEAVARRAAETFRAAPILNVDLREERPQPKLPAPSTQDDGIDADPEDYDVDGDQW